MTTTEAEILAFPDVRSGADPASPNAQVPAPARAHAREEGTPIPAEPRRLSISLRMPSTRVLSGVLAGSSLMASAAPAILTVWAAHKAAAGYYQHWFAKYPRLAYGAGHAFLEVPFLYLWAWSGHSPVLRVAVLATIVIILHLLGVHIIWSWL